MPAKDLAAGIEDFDLVLEDAHGDCAVRGGGQRRVVGALDLHEPGVVHRARGLPEEAKALRGQGLEVRLLLAEHLQHLAFLAPVDA